MPRDMRALLDSNEGEFDGTVPRNINKNNNNSNSNVNDDKQQPLFEQELYVGAEAMEIM